MIDMFLTSDEKERLVNSLNSSMNAVKDSNNTLANKKGYVWLMNCFIEKAELYNTPRRIMCHTNITIPCTVDIYDIIDFYLGASLAHRTFIWEIEEIDSDRHIER